MLHQRYESAEKDNAPGRKRLVAFLTSLSKSESSFVSLNWDTSLERTLQAISPVSEYSYGSGILKAQFAGDGKIRVDRKKADHKIRIAKMHGSAN
jgi:hypothetical protein